MASRITLQVAIYQPRFGNYYHWAIYIYDIATERHVIAEVRNNGDDGFIAVKFQANPRHSDTLVKLIAFAILPRTALPAVLSVIDGVPVQAIAHWDCQDYVLEVIEALHENELIGDFPKYGQVIRSLHRMRGDIESTSAYVRSYDYNTLPADDDDEEQDVSGSEEESEENDEDDSEDEDVEEDEDDDDDDDDDEDDDDEHVVVRDSRTYTRSHTGRRRVYLSSQYVDDSDSD